jgi:hypothetical protein
VRTDQHHLDAVALTRQQRREHTSLTNSHRPAETMISDMGSSGNQGVKPFLYRRANTASEHSRLAIVAPIR